MPRTGRSSRRLPLRNRILTSAEYLELERTYQPLIRKELALVAGSLPPWAADANELRQTWSMAIIEAHAELDPSKGSFATILRWKLRQHFTELRRGIARQQAAVTAATPSAIDEIAQAQLRIDIDAAFSTLTESELLVSMMILNGYRQREIARMRRVSEAMISKTKLSAFGKLRVALSAWGWAA